MLNAAMIMTQGTVLSQTHSSEFSMKLNLNAIKKEPQNEQESPAKELLPPPKRDGGLHQITSPYAEMSMRRQKSNTDQQLNNSAVNNSNLLNSDEFDMSNTSMSLQTQSQIQLPDTERGNILIESGNGLHEDSSMLQECDEPRVPVSAAHYEVLLRQFRPASSNDTPQQIQERDDPTKVQKVPSAFEKCE